MKKYTKEKIKKYIKNTDCCAYVNLNPYLEIKVHGHLHSKSILLNQQIVKGYLQQVTNSQVSDHDVPHF